MSFTNPYPASRLTLDATNSLSNGLVGFWPLTDGGSSTTAKDITSNANDGTQSGGVSWASTDIGTAASFDGVDDRFDLTSIGSMDFSSSDFTVSLWIYIDSISAPEYLWTKQTSGNSPSCIFWFATSTTLQLIHQGSTTGCKTDYTIASSLVGGWNHLVASVSSPSSLLASNHAVYLNGELLTPNASQNGAGTITESSGTLSLAGRMSDNLRQLSGDYQNVRVYNRALSATEVATLYNRPWEGTNYGDLWPYSPPAPADATLSTDTAATSLMSGCVAWWPLTDGSGSSPADVSGNSETLTNGGSSEWGVQSVGNVAVTNNNTGAYYSSDSAFSTMIGGSTPATDPWTISFWVSIHLEAFAYGEDGILSIGSSSNDGTPFLIIQRHFAAFRFYWGGAYTNVSGVSNRTWANVTLTFDGTTMDCYVDGALGGTRTSAGANGSTSDKFWIGTGYNNNDTAPDDYFQNVRIWNRALSTDEITLLAERPFEGLTYGDAFHYDPPTPANLTPLDNSSGINTGQELWLPLTDGTGTTAVDISGGGNDGTLSGNDVGWHVSRLGGTGYTGFSADRITTSATVSAQPITVSMWCRSIGSAGGFNHFFDGVGTDRVRAYNTGTINMGTATSTASTSVVYDRDGSWQHFVFVYDSGNGTIYKNGVEGDTVTGIGSGTLASGLIIGDQQSGGGYGLYSDISNVRVWSRALSAAEVWSIYENPWLGSAYSDAAAVVYQYILRSKRFRRL